jgi:hypothetical protein
MRCLFIGIAQPTSTIGYLLCWITAWLFPSDRVMTLAHSHVRWFRVLKIASKEQKEKNRIELWEIIHE